MTKTDIKMPSIMRRSSIITDKYIIEFSDHKKQYAIVYFLSNENWKNKKSHDVLCKVYNLERVSMSYSEFWRIGGTLWDTMIFAKWRWVYVKNDFEL